MSLRLLATLAVSALWCAVSLAALPVAYRPMVVMPIPLASSSAAPNIEFDITAAQERARREGKSLYLYLGAKDCPYCQAYEAFLDGHADELMPHFGKYLIVDLRSSLSVTAPHLFFKVGGVSRPYAEFLRAMGDERASRLVYPSVWLLDGALKPLMQMPAGAGTFMTVPEQLEVLRLQQ